ncbi:hypothetical protein HQN89_17535 [Paenibacillus frigoriresistens]|nr:hypothetical protein [Paenibacillus frigoriresistens]
MRQLTVKNAFDLDEISLISSNWSYLLYNMQFVPVPVTVSLKLTVVHTVKASSMRQDAIRVCAAVR